MKKIYLIAGITLIGLLALSLTKASFARRSSSGRSRRVLIGFNDGTGPQAAERRRSYIRGHGGRVRRSYRHLPAAAAELSEIQISRLRTDPRVAYIEEDGEVHALDTELDDSWGVKHIDAGNVHPNNKGTGIKVAVIDTGIDYGHLDLDDNYKGGYDFVNSDDDPMDDHGHGTHCAGIIAAEDNDQGVIGVAPEASLYAVKVLNSGGSGYLSDVVAGIEWAIDNNMDIISMSLGTDYDYQTLREACDNASAAGILLVAAAGNDYSVRRGSERDTVDYPARYDSVIAVGATDDTDVKASWSSTGSALELAAPGVDIYSTYPGNSYATKSGTSMACPHVAGAAALILAGPNGGVRTVFQDTADDLGDAGWDNWYGYGLVDAGEAAGISDTPPELVSIEVSPVTTTIPKGYNQQYIAIGTYSDAGTSDITTTVAWASSDTGAATIDATGLAAGVGEGTTSITASLDSVTSNQAKLTVEAPILVSISVEPKTASIEIDSIQQYSATGIYSDWSEVDITTTAAWASSNTGTATIDATGLATGKGVGATSITGSLDIITSNNAELTVTPPPPTLKSITVTPADVSIPAGSTQQYTATGIYSDSSTADITGSVTWTSLNDSVATISTDGLAAAVAQGNTTITAAHGIGITGSTKLTVTEAPADVQAFSDSFESSSDWSANWSQDSQNDWYRRTSRSFDGSYSAEVDGRATDSQLISRDINLQGKTNAAITFWWYIESGLDTGEYLAFDVSTDGGAWTERARLRGNVDPENTWHNVSIDVAANNLRIRFRGKISSSREDAYVDMVKVIAW